MAAPRKFDHDAARALRAQGWTWQALAAKFGVSVQAVRFVCLDAEREAQREYHKRWSQTTCSDCGAPCIRYYRNGEQRARCKSCARKAMATSVRDTELLCMGCREWKPDDAFPGDRLREHRRGRHNECRACNTKQRQARRERNREAARAYDREYKRRKRQAA